MVLKHVFLVSEEKENRETHYNYVSEDGDEYASYVGAQRRDHRGVARTEKK